MLKKDKERIVGDIAERLRSSETLIVADYRGLSMTQIDEVRTKLLGHGAVGLPRPLELVGQARVGLGGHPAVDPDDGEGARLGKGRVALRVRDVHTDRALRDVELRGRRGGGGLAGERHGDGGQPDGGC